MLASGVLLGLVAGLAVGRSWRPLAAVQIRWLPLILAGIVARVAGALVTPIAFPLYLFALFGTAAGAAANIRLTGAALVAIGGVLNLVVVVLNQGMPVDTSALTTASASMPTDALHVSVNGGTVLAGLADVIPVALVHGVYSVGDVFIAVGGFVVPFVLLIRR